MKNYQVLSKVGRFSACVEREFDEYTDAKAFCDLLKNQTPRHSQNIILP